MSAKKATNTMAASQAMPKPTEKGTLRTCLMKRVKKDISGAG